MKMKKCSKCSEVKPESDFYRNNKQNDGFDYYCKACKNQMNEKWKKDNPKKSRALQNKYQKRRRAKNGLSIEDAIKKKKQRISNLIKEIRDLMRMIKK
jgi:hypothetical protein